MITDVTGVLLAGGKSRRMGEDKRFLYVGERTLLDRSCAALQEIFEQVYVVVAQDSPTLQTEVPIIRDLIANCGSLGGLYTGLRQAKTEYIFLTACDMPFLNSRLIRYFVSLKCDKDVVIGRWRSRLHPTHALYGQRCCSVIEEMLHGNYLQIQGLMANSSLRVRVVEENELEEIDREGRSFFNVNTPSDLIMARDLTTKRSDSGS